MEPHRWLCGAWSRRLLTMVLLFYFARIAEAEAPVMDPLSTFPWYQFSKHTNFVLNSTGVAHPNGILLEIPLVIADTLKPRCDDIVFLAGDFVHDANWTEGSPGGENRPLWGYEVAHWIEGGCSYGPSLRVWLDFPLSATNVTVYHDVVSLDFYTRELLWDDYTDNQFVFISNSTECHSEVTTRRLTEMDGKIPRMTINPPPFFEDSTSDHSHPRTTGLTSSMSGTSEYCGAFGSTPNWAGANHNHPVSHSCDSVVNEVDSVSSLFCVGNNHALELARGSIVLVLGDEEEVLLELDPLEWKQVTLMEGNYPVGSSLFGNFIPASFDWGTHVHSLGYSIGGTSTWSGPCGGGGSNPMAKIGHAHPPNIASSSTTGPDQVDPPFQVFRFVESLQDWPQHLPDRLIVATLSDQPPPLGYSILDCCPESLIRGKSSTVTAAGGSPTHSHSPLSPSVTFQVPPADEKKDAASGNSGCLLDHTHSFSFSNVPMQSNYPPFRDILFLRRHSSVATVRFDQATLHHWYCNGIHFAQSSVCNYGRGECIGTDMCRCRSGNDYYGSDCQEYIAPEASYMNAEHTVIHCPFHLRLTATVLVVTYQGWNSSIPFVEEDCDLRVVDASAMLGENAVCGWLLPDPYTRETSAYEILKITNPDISALVLRAKTSAARATVSVVAFVPDVLPQNQTVPKPSESTPFPVGAIVGPVGGVAVLAALLVVILISIFACWRRRVSQRTSLLEAAVGDDLDILLEERRVQEECSMPTFQVKKSLFSVEIADIEILKVLGEGGSGSIVYLAKWQGQEIAFVEQIVMLRTHDLYRYKAFKASDFLKNESLFHEFENELTLMSSLKHPNLLPSYGATLKPPRIGILMEYCPNGDLKVYLSTKEEEGEEIPLGTRIDMVRNILRGLSFLHGKNIIHRDMKCANVLVAADLRCVIMDLGLSRLVAGEQSLTRAIGTSRYMAPEITLGYDYDVKVDIFSVAIMMWEIFALSFRPYENEEFIEMKVASNPHLRPQVAKLPIPGWLQTTLKRSWDADPTIRPTAAQLLELLDKGRDAGFRVIYLQRETDSAEDAWDVVLRDISLLGLERAVRSCWPDQSQAVLSFFLSRDDGAHVPLMPESDLDSLLVADSLVLVRFVEVQDGDDPRSALTATNAELLAYVGQLEEEITSLKGIVYQWEQYAQSLNGTNSPFGFAPPMDETLIEELPPDQKVFEESLQEELPEGLKDA